MTNAVSLAQQASTGVSPGFRNRIINCAMVIDQRNAGAAVTLGSGGSSFIVDRFRADAPVDQSMTFQQQTSVVPNGFSTSFKVTAGTGTTTATNQPILAQFIEGFNTADLKWGTANAKTVTLSFQVYSSLTGTFGVCFENNAANRGYIASYTISSANTWTSASITIPGDTSGTWEITNQRGLSIFFDLGVGTSFSTSASSGWANLSGYRGLTGGVKLAANTGATWYITGVQLEVGSTATSFDYRPYGTELALCQRYFVRLINGNGQELGSGWNFNTTQLSGLLYAPVSMRATPSLISSSGTDYYIFYRDNVGDTFNSLTIELSNATNNVVSYYNNSQISGTAGQCGLVRSNNASASVALSSEL